MGEIVELDQARPKLKFKVKAIASGYHFEFANGIEAKISRVSESKSAGTTTGEILITSRLPGHPAHLYQARVNLTSAQAKSGLEKELFKRLEADWWQEILECLTSETLRLHRQGEPLQTISTEDDITRPEYLLHPLLVRNHPSVVFGLGGTSKSLLGLTWGLVIQLPMIDNPLRMKTLTKSTSVLYLDYETDGNEYGWRLKCLQKGFGFDYIDIQYRRQSVPVADDIERLQEIVSETGAELVIVDSLGPACGGADLNASEPAMRFYGALRTLKVTSLTLAHTAKTNEMKQASIYGTVFFTNLARSVWELKKQQDHGKDHIEVGLYHRKCNYSRLFDPLGFIVKFTETSITIERDDKNAVTQEHSTNREKIIDCLTENGPMTLREIESELAIEDRILSSTLSQMKKSKKVVQLGDKRWGIVSPIEFTG